MCAHMPASRTVALFISTPFENSGERLIHFMTNVTKFWIAIEGLDVEKISLGNVRTFPKRIMVVRKRLVVKRESSKWGEGCERRGERDTEAVNGWNSFKTYPPSAKAP